MRSSEFILDGRTQRYLSGGDEQNQRVLVWLHAFPIGVSVWEQQLDAFPGWTVIAPALPGFDGSELANPASVESYATAVSALLTHLGISRAVVGGLSLGGYVAFALLKQRPELCSALILADTRSTADAPEARGSREKMLSELSDQGVGAIADEVVPKLLGATTQRSHPALVARVRERIMAQRPEAIAGAIRAMIARPDATPALGALHIPALVIVGEEDVLTPPAEAERLRGAIPDATLVHIPAAGHLSSLENPTAFNQAVSAFLHSLRF